MATLERGLGRGLDSLLRSTREADIPSRDAKKLALTQLTPGKHQPRKRFDDATLADLAASIKNQGIVQPLIVRPRADSSPQLYEIVAGERRWRAARLAGLTEVPVVISSYTDAEAMTVALVENLQRENLSPLEEAEALQTLRDTHKLNQDELAAKLGKSRSAVANSLRLLQLPQNCRDALADSSITAGHARALLAIGDEETRDSLLKGIIQRDLSVRDAESIADYWKRTGRLPAPLDEDNAGGVAAAKERRRRTLKPQRLKDIQALLRKTVHHGASISGNEEKGRIALPYSSAGELESLLTLLGMDVERQDIRGIGESVPVSGSAMSGEESAPADDSAALETEGFAMADDAASAGPVDSALMDGSVSLETESSAPAPDTPGPDAGESVLRDEGVSPEAAESALTDDSAALETEGFAPADDAASAGPEDSVLMDGCVSLESESSAPAPDTPSPDAEESALRDEGVSPEAAESAPADDSVAFEAEGFDPADDAASAGLEDSALMDGSVSLETESSAPAPDTPGPEAGESVLRDEGGSPEAAESAPADDSAAFEAEGFEPAGDGASPASEDSSPVNDIPGSEENIHA